MVAGSALIDGTRSSGDVTVQNGVTSIGDSGCKYLTDVSYLDVNDIFWHWLCVFDDAVLEVKVSHNCTAEIFCFKPVNKILHNFKEEVFTPTETARRNLA